MIKVTANHPFFVASRALSRAFAAPDGSTS